ncbi:MAG: oligosaccharide flippase family protein [Firmicutes bacterium]|nr:oligosaccharide flippase family protein [Candidatus Caballimonas caccae]
MKGFFKTVVIVTVFGFCEKFLGFLYRIFLSHKIGSEGIGLYQIALSIFALILTLCCSGTPVTVSRLMTKYQAENNKISEKKVISAGILLTLFTTLPVCIFLFCFRNILNFAFSDIRAKTLFYIILPGLVFTSIYSVLRGIFWGKKDFLPYSIIELLEEIAMIVCGIFLISKTDDVFKGAKFASIAVTFSFIVSFSIATFVFFFRKNKIISPKGELLPLIQSSAPVTAMRTANSLTSSLISIVLPARLISVGFSSAEAMSLFGASVGQAIPILFAPTSLIGSFTLVLIPQISEDFYKKDFNKLKRDIEISFKFAIFLTCLFLPLFLVCGEEIGMTIFKSEKCGEYLTASSFLILFVGLSNISTSILNSMGKEKYTLIFFLISALCMFFSIWFLPKYIVIYSLLVGFVFVYGLTAILNIFLIRKTCPIKPQVYRFAYKTILIQFPSILLGLMLEKMILFPLGTIATLIICTIVILPFNAFMFIAFNLVSMDEIVTFLPFLKKKQKRQRKSVAKKTA